MPGTMLGSGVSAGTSTPIRQRDRWLNFRWAYPPLRDIRDREDSPGARNPTNLWPDGDLIGDETLGMSIMKLKVYDDDIRFGGTKAFSYTIAGQCLDSGGAPVSGATVELWLTSPEYPDSHQPLLVGATTADAQGKYGFAVPDTVKKYHVVAYVAGKGGVTARDLVGS
jgi:hypothetical protein